MNKKIIKNEQPTGAIVDGQGELRDLAFHRDVMAVDVKDIKGEAKDMRELDIKNRLRVIEQFADQFPHTAACIYGQMILDYPDHADVKTWKEQQAFYLGTTG